MPKHRLVAFTGVSGSGKSSLVFDTICTEAQRQLVETFSTYARRRLPQLTRPPVDAIRNISPCIVIDQKRLDASSRSTVGTVTEIYTYLRMLFSRCGRPFAGWSHRFSFNHPDGMYAACRGLGTRITVDPARGQGGVSAAVHRAGVPRLRRRSAQRRGARGGAGGRPDHCGRGCAHAQEQPEHEQPETHAASTDMYSRAGCEANEGVRRTPPYTDEANESAVCAGDRCDGWMNEAAARCA